MWPKHRLEKTLLYTPQFKSWLDAHKTERPIFRFLQVRASGAASYESGGLSIIRLPRRNGLRHDTAWRVDMGSETFFVKETRCNIVTRYSTGPVEFRALEELERLAREPMDVVSRYAAFSNGKTSFIVTRFLAYPNAGECRSIPAKLLAELGRLAAIAFRHGNIADVRRANAFYVAARGRLILFDPVILKPSDWLIVPLSLAAAAVRKIGQLTDRILSPRTESPKESLVETQTKAA